MKRKNMTKFDKVVSATFTGHRFYNFSQQEVIRERLTKPSSKLTSMASVILFRDSPSVLT